MQTAIPSPILLKRSTLYGSLTNRFVAFLVDTTLLFFWYTILLYAMAKKPEHLYTWKDLWQENNLNLLNMILIGKTLFFNLYFPVLHWLYYTLLEASPKQATIGKFTLGLEVTDVRGNRIGLAQANLRYFSKFASALPLCLGFLLILNTRRKQMLHDYIAQTVVTTK
ncbi:RDD family protein [Pontibacter sp. 172403-2]|uniref:RDD family protein n=1 Tax=Pontibacter rufus TaxID=2791028 RepID=UPI0018AFAC8C|nr:RDD family protein [Pontibacter sp. 172403-2]MBF9255358.1 RDD family protein [Pontibacter sp. 172403-2]